MAPTLPAGVTGPDRFSLAGDGESDVNFVVVRGAAATRYYGNGAAVIAFVRSALGLSLDPVLDASVLSALRTMLQRSGVDASRVSATQLDRETIRAMLWWGFVRGTADEGTPATRVWLPGGTLTVPSLGSRVPGSTTAAIRSEPLRPRTATPATGGGSGLTTIPASGGGRTGTTGSAPGGAPPARPPATLGQSTTAGVTSAASTGVKAVLVTGLVGAVVVAAMKAKDGDSADTEDASVYRAVIARNMQRLRNPSRYDPPAAELAEEVVAYRRRLAAITGNPEGPLSASAVLASVGLSGAAPSRQAPPAAPRSERANGSAGRVGALLKGGA